MFLFDGVSISCRDIPMPLVTSGVEHGNLRELALARMKDLGTEVQHIILFGISYIYQTILISTKYNCFGLQDLPKIIR